MSIHTGFFQLLLQLCLPWRRSAHSSLRGRQLKQTRLASQTAKIRSFARTAAFCSTKATVATGMPEGICTAGAWSRHPCCPSLNFFGNADNGKSSAGANAPADAQRIPAAQMIAPNPSRQRFWQTPHFLSRSDGHTGECGPQTGYQRFLIGCRQSDSRPIAVGSHNNCNFFAHHDIRL